MRRSLLPPAGKWNAGMAHTVQTPHGRGYDSGLTYFDYMTGAPAGWGLSRSSHCC